MYAMDVASVMEAWDDIDTETESESSDVSVESDEDAAAQECVDETSNDEEPESSANTPAPSRTSRRSRTAGRR